MLILITTISISLLIASLFLFLNFSISKKNFLNREKSSAFECGFDPLSASRTPFSVQFFLVSMIFLIFDIEISLLIPLIYLYKFLNPTMIFLSLIFLLLLLTGLYLEWSEKSLDWKT